MFSKGVAAVLWELFIGRSQIWCSCACERVFLGRDGLSYKRCVGGSAIKRPKIGLGGAHMMDQMFIRCFLLIAMRSCLIMHYFAVYLINLPSHMLSGYGCESEAKLNLRDKAVQDRSECFLLRKYYETVATRLHQSCLLDVLKTPRNSALHHNAPICNLLPQRPDGNQ